MENINTTPPNSYPPNSLQEFFDNTPEKWIKGTYARKTDGTSCEDDDSVQKEGVCFCILGGIRKLYNVNSDIALETLEVREKIQYAIFKLFPNRYGSIHHFNDHPETTFEDIKAVLKEANV